MPRRPIDGGAPMTGKVLIVTGGSRGIGAATCRLAGQRGYAVVVNYRSDASAAASVVADIETAGGKAVAMQADVAREAEVERLFAEAETRFGRVTHLVNNAGITGRGQRLDAVDVATLEAIFDLNILGAFLCARAAVQRMSTSRGGNGGVIVNLSSGGCSRGHQGQRRRPWPHPDRDPCDFRRTRASRSADANGAGRPRGHRRGGCRGDRLPPLRGRILRDRRSAPRIRRALTARRR